MPGILREKFACYSMVVLIGCIDADYREDEAVTALVGIRDWADEAPCVEHVVRAPQTPSAYVPGSFYLRELPGVLAVLAAAPPVDVVVIDGYVWLGVNRPGLGARLFEASHVPIVGVAKTRFHDNAEAIELTRGGSSRPLYVTAAGMDVNDARAAIAQMHGAYRIPTILRRVDRLARDA
jgi:deoxyribonuclease V